MVRFPRPDLLVLAAFITLAGVTAVSLIEIDRIVLRWLALILLVVFAVLQTRFPRQDGSLDSRRQANILLGIQMLLVCGLILYAGGALSFLLLFFILSAFSMLFNPLRLGLVWITAFTLLTGAFLVRADGWSDGLGDLVIYFSGYLLLGIIVNALSQARLAQQQIALLLVELQAKNRQLEAYARQVETLAAVEERNRLAREVHDTLGHSLTAAAVQLEAIQRIALSNPERAARLADEVRQQVRAALQELRQTVGRLREPVEVELSLPQALRRLSESFQQATGMPIHLQIPDAACQVTPAQRMALFRTAQEGLTNIQRHAQASQAWLRLECPPGRIVLLVEDDGRGLPEPANGTERSSSFGLRGLQERADQLGGEVTLSPRLPGGAALKITLPVQEHSETHVADQTSNR